MPLLLQLNALSVGTASSTLLDSADAMLVEGDCVGLVGPNGSGKSTLLNVLSDDDEVGKYWAITSGSIDGDLSPSQRVPGSVLLVNQDVLSWSSLLPGVASEEELRELPLRDALELAMALGFDEALNDEESWRRLSVAAGEALCWNLAGYEDTPLGRLSPGCALRAYLAVALYRPEVRLLLLDEPTNHLDLPSILWLQHAIRGCRGKSFIIVSHDEAFLDAVASHVWEVSGDAHPYTLTVSGAQYSAYKRSKAAALEQQRRAYDAQQARQLRLTAAAGRLREKAAAGAAHQSRDRDLLQRGFKRNRAGRSGKRAAAVERLRDSGSKVERVVDRVPLRIRLQPVGSGGSSGSDSSLQMSAVQLGYAAPHTSGGSTAADGGGGADAGVDVALPVPPLSLRVDYGERVALLGFNGVGKSTLLRTLTAQLPPLAGSVTVGRDLRLGNLTQAHASLPRQQTPREFIAERTDLDRFTGGSRLIGFGLSRAQVDAPIGELNPGARARLLLALFSMRSVNVLVLDEPTNHLDEEAVAELCATLNGYQGTVVVVSHDRHFLASISLSKLLLLSPQGLREVESVEALVEGLEHAVRRVVQACA